VAGHATDESESSQAAITIQSADDPVRTRDAKSEADKRGLPAEGLQGIVIPNPCQTADDADIPGHVPLARQETMKER
jgi:hypothetical protein